MKWVLMFENYFLHKFIIVDFCDIIIMNSIILALLTHCSYMCYCYFGGQSTFTSNNISLCNFEGNSTF